MYLLRCGVSQAQVARQSGIPRSTVRTWIAAGMEATLNDRLLASHTLADALGSEDCQFVRQTPEAPYAYLLGLYLGDGCLSATRKGVYRLRVSLDTKYPGIIAEAAAAMADVLPNKVGFVQAPGACR